MGLIELPFRIIALPIMLLVGSITVFYKLFLNVGSLVAGLAYIVLGLCIVSCLMQHYWVGIAILIVAGAMVFLGVMFAATISLALEALLEKLGEFIFS